MLPQGEKAVVSQSQAQSALADDSASNLSSSSWIARSPARNPLSFRTMQARVTLLDGSMFTCTTEVRQLWLGYNGVKEGDSKITEPFLSVRNELEVCSCSRRCATTLTCWSETTSLCPSEMLTATRCLSVQQSVYLTVFTCLSDL